LIGCLIGTVIVGILLIITNIVSIIRAGRMMPKELKGIDLSNKEKEIDIASQMDIMLTNSMSKALDWQNKFDALDCKYRDQGEELKKIKLEFESQSSLINLQEKRILALEELSISQKKEIDILMTEVNNYSLWTNALVSQLQKVDLKPIKMEEVDGIDLSILKNNKVKAKIKEH